MEAVKVFRQRIQTGMRGYRYQSETRTRFTGHLILAGFACEADSVVMDRKLTQISNSAWDVDDSEKVQKLKVDMTQFASHLMLAGLACEAGSTVKDRTPTQISNSGSGALCYSISTRVRVNGCSTHRL